MAIDMTKDYQFPMNQNPQREMSSVVKRETTYSQKITKESVDELIKEIDKLINKVPL